MSEWTKQPIKELLDGQWPGEWGSESQLGSPPVVVYRSTDLDDAGHLLEDEGVYRSIPPSKFKAKRLVAGDILIEASGGAPDRPVGRAALFSALRGEAAIGANFLRTLRPKKAVCSSFLRWALVALQRQSAIWRYQQQTTGMSNLKVSDYLNHRIDVPPLPQQRQIAEILSTVDEAIEQTEALIAKCQQIKAGLMQDLFTRGVTPDGHLRPTSAQAPHLYKESPLGWIPKEWSAELLDRLSLRGSGHTPNKNQPDFWNGGIKWVSLADSWRLDRLYISETDKEISQLGIENSSAVLHPPGIVVLSRDAGVGKSAITTCSMAVSQHFMCWRCGPQLDNHYLYYWLQYRKREFENIATGSTIPTIGLRFFKYYRINVSTDIEEQRHIGSALLSADHTIFSLETDVGKLRQQKQGLMQDLLTGRVRVKVGEAEEQR